MAGPLPLPLLALRTGALQRARRTCQEVRYLSNPGSFPGGEVLAGVCLSKARQEPVAMAGSWEGAGSASALWQAELREVLAVCTSTAATSGHWQTP